MKANKIIKSIVVSAFAVLIVAGYAYAGLADCVGDGKKYPNLQVVGQGQTATAGYVKCQQVQERDTTGAITYLTIYGKTSADCASASALASDPDGCQGGDINTMIRTIINAIIFVVGMVAVVMIILGGVNYATSQGDTNKVKKGKDTILYGIIGLVIAILAFAIVNFVLQALQQ